MRVALFSMPDLIPHFRAHIWQPPSLACSLIAASLKPAHEAVVADLILQRHRVREAVKEVLAEHRPQLAALSAMSFQFATAKRVAETIKEADPTVKVALGGYHATLMGEEMTTEGDGRPFDFIIRGEGDHVLAELATALEKGRPVDGIGGLSFRADGTFVHNPRRPLEPVQDIPIPERSARVWSGYHFGHQPLDVLETSRGCTMSCNFCSMQHMYGRTFRLFPLERVIRDIADAKRHGTRWIAFADDNITLDIQRFEELCDAITANGLNDIGYIIQASCPGIGRDPRLAAKMDQANFRIAFLGIENISPRNLALMHKGNILEATKRAVQYLHDKNIMIVGGMIIGHPDDTEEDIAANYEFFDQADIDFFGDQIITPYPKTGMRQELLDLGLVTNPDDFRLYNGYWANVRTRSLTPDQIQFLRWKYRNKYSTFQKSTKAFRANHPIVDAYRRFWLRPYRAVKHALLNRGKSERQLYEEAMNRDMALNDFFGDPGYAESWRPSVQGVPLPPLPEAGAPPQAKTDESCGVR